MPDGSGMLFRVAAGPRIGFGHLVRAVSLSRAMGATPVVSLRGGDVARETARRLGCTVTDRPAGDAISHYRPSVVVIDDPRASAAEHWVRTARHHGVPSASLLDRGLGARGTDLAIDGGPCPRGSRTESRHALRGPRYMVLDPIFLATRHGRRSRRHRTVAIALGGGAHATYGERVGAELAPVIGAERVCIARGFAANRDAAIPSREIHAALLADADVALVGGGVGLYEACCVGVPTVAVAVTPEQRETIRAFARADAVVNAGVLNRVDDRGAARRVARCVLELLDDQPRRRRLSANARRAVDGRGSRRVAAALRGLADS